METPQSVSRDILNINVEKSGIGCPSDSKTKSSDGRTLPTNIKIKKNKDTSRLMRIKQEITSVSVRYNNQSSTSSNSQKQIGQCNRLPESNKKNVSNPSTNVTRLQHLTENQRGQYNYEEAAFFQTQVNRNIALQSILSDIFTLSGQYNDDSDEISLDEEIEKLRAKNKLPSFKPKDPIISVEDSDYDDENNSQSSDDDRSLYNNSEHYTNDSDAIGSEKSESSKTHRIYQIAPNYISTRNAHDDVTADRLIIDELGNQTDEPEYIDIESLRGAKRKHGESVGQSTDCIISRKSFKTSEKLKNHLVVCSKTTDKVSANSSPQSSEHSFNITFYPSKDSTPGSPESSSKDSTIDPNIDKVFSTCPVEDSDFEGIKTDVSKHCVKVHKPKFQRTCAKCNVTFQSKDSLEKHCKKTCYSDCETKDNLDIIEIDDDD